MSKNISVKIVETIIKYIALAGCVGVAIMLLTAPMWQAMAYYKSLCTFMALILVFPAYAVLAYELQEIRKK